MQTVGLNLGRSRFLLMLPYGDDVLADFLEAVIPIEGLISVLDEFLSHQPISKIYMIVY